MSSALAPLRAAPRLPRTVKLLGAVSLLNDFASEMIYPLLPAFMTGVLGAGPQALGELDGAAEFAASVVEFGAGRLEDRRSRSGPLDEMGFAVGGVGGRDSVVAVRGNTVGSVLITGVGRKL